MTQTTAGAQRPRAQHFGSRVLKAPVVAHAGLLISWMVLWRFPVLMGDDRFFAITSELSRGRRTWEGIVKIIRDCWTIHNGRLADGAGKRPVRSREHRYPAGDGPVLHHLDLPPVGLCPPAWWSSCSPGICCRP